MSYALKFGGRQARTAPARQPARHRLLREDVAVAPPVEAPPVDPAVAGVVSAVEAVAPVTRRYRATVTRTVTETALVEFDAPETADLYVMAEALLPQIPADAWVESAADSWGYIDKIETIDAPPATEQPAAETLSDDLEPVDEEVEPEAPADASRQRLRQRRARMTGVRLVGARMAHRMTADDALTTINNLLAQADEVVAVQPTTYDEAVAQIEQLAQIDAQLVEHETMILANLTSEEATPVMDASFAALTAIEQMTYALEETASALLAAEEAEPMPALEPV